jgi:hypothetical protein
MKTRTLDRTRLIYHLRVFDTAGDTVLGHLADITPDGMLLIGEKAIPIGKDWTLRMVLPRNVPVGRTVVFRATSRWSKPDDTGEFFQTGFHIEEIEKGGLSHIRKLIQDFQQPASINDIEEEMNPKIKVAGQ